MDGTDEWTQIPFPTITYADSTSINLTGLQEGTTYQVVVALSDDFSGMVIESCATLIAPSLSGVSIRSITQTSAIATVTIADAGTAQKTVLLQYREFGESEWISTEPKTTEGASESFDLTGLTPNTKYEVEASLSSDFSGAMAVTFTTLAPEPSVSSVKVEDISQAAATAIAAIANSDGTSQTVYVRYRTTTPHGEWRNAPETTSATGQAFYWFDGTNGRHRVRSGGFA